MKKIEVREHGKAIVNISGRQVLIRFEKEPGQLPEVITANYHNPEQANPERVDLFYNVKAKRIGNYSVANPSQAPAKIATFISGIKNEIEEIINELTKALTDEK